MVADAVDYFYFVKISSILYIVNFNVTTPSAKSKQSYNQ